MNKTVLFAAIGMLAAATSTLSLATAREYRADLGDGILSGHGKQDIQLAWDSRKREQPKRTRPYDGFDHGMQVVPTTAGPGQPGDRWRYFSDPAADRAVVISPLGVYFFSQGKGPRLVAVTEP